MAVAGLWNIGPVNLPDFGISEKLSALTGQSATGGFFGIPNNANVGGQVLGNATYGLSPTSNQQNYMVQNPVVTTPGFSGPTNPNPTPNTSPTQGAQTYGGYGWQNLPGYAGWDPNAAAADFAQTGGAGKGATTSGAGPDYSSFFSQLDNIVNNLGGQSANLQNQAQDQYNQQQNTLDLQKTQGEQSLNNYQAKTLKDIGSTISNGFKAGANYLGSIGAGDSSAANQYAYALNKIGSQQRGNVMADVSQRMQNLQQTYNTTSANLKAALNQKVNEIAQWFSQQQAALQGQKAEVAKQQSDQAYQTAIQALQVAQQQAAGMQNALNSWVANNATSLQQAIQGIQANAQNFPIPTSINSTPTFSNNAAAQSYYNNANSNSDNKNSLFNNYNWLNRG